MSYEEGRATIVVPGKPVAQGSMVAYGRKVAASNASALGLYRDRVGIAAAREWGEDRVDSESPFEVRITFLFGRPKSHYGKKGLRPSAPPFHVKRPDIDKLARAVLDSLTHIVFADDSQVTSLIVAKNYTEQGNDHCAITVRTLG